MRRIETNDWWSDLVKLKDELSLRELAEKFEVTPGAISAAFKRTGISRRPAPPGPRARRKSTPDLDDLPPEPGEVAGEDARPGSKDAQILPFVDLLGNVPDQEVADRAGVSVRTIASYRARKGISGYAGPRKRRRPAPARKSKIDAYADMLGQVPDRVIADKAGVTLNAVRNYRAKRGIAAATRSGGETIEVSRPVVAAPALDGSDSAWRVVVEADEGMQETRVVVAASLSEAASRAETAGIGHVVSMEWLGEVV